MVPPNVGEVPVRRRDIDVGQGLSLARTGRAVPIYNISHGALRRRAEAEDVECIGEHESRRCQRGLFDAVAATLQSIAAPWRATVTFKRRERV